MVKVELKKVKELAVELSGVIDINELHDDHSVTLQRLDANAYASLIRLLFLCRNIDA